MKIDRFDHLVVTTQDLERCLHFYVDILGMELDDGNRCGISRCRLSGERSS